jgi:hypothetical protein
MLQMKMNDIEFYRGQVLQLQLDITKLKNQDEDIMRLQEMLHTKTLEAEEVFDYFYLR